MWTKKRLTEEEIAKKMSFIDGVPAFQKGPSLFSFPIEYTFDQERMLEWFKQNWHTSIYWCAFYLFIIYVGRVNNKFEDQVISN